MHERLNNLEEDKYRFFLTIKQGENVFGKFDKFEFNLDPSRNIVEQAEMTISTILDSFEIPESTRENFSWKVYRNQGRLCNIFSVKSITDPLKILNNALS